MFGKKSENTEEKKIGLSSSIRYGSYSAALIVIVLAIVIVINLLASQLPEKVNSMDLTANKLYSIGSDTEKVLESLDKDIDLIVLAKKDSAQDTLVKMLGRYEDASKKIHVKYEDPTVNLELVQKYNGMNAGSVIVRCGEKEKAVDLMDIFPADYASYYTTGNISYSFDGEGQITSAINYVTSDVLPIMYTVTGHSESALSETVTGIISQQNIEQRELNLMTSNGIPEDCKCLLINGPQSDYSEEEAKTVIDYLNNGGKVLLLASYTAGDMPNFDSILDAYGITVNKGIVMEGANHYYQYPLYVIGTLGSDEITKELAASGANILVPYAKGFTQNDREDIAMTELMTTSADAYLKSPNDAGAFTTLDKESGDQSGTFGLIYLATKIDANDNADEDSDRSDSGQLLAISAATMIEDEVNNSFSLGNLELFGDCLAYLCSDDDSNVISIPSKSMAADYITVPALQVMIFAAVCVVIIPVTILVIGLIIWLRRRKK